LNWTFSGIEGILGLKFLMIAPQVLILSNFVFTMDIEAEETPLMSMKELKL
jgi:hypothetical protein